MKQKQLLMVAFLGQADMPDELLGHALAVSPLRFVLAAIVHCCLLAAAASVQAAGRATAPATYQGSVRPAFLYMHLHQGSVQPEGQPHWLL